MRAQLLPYFKSLNSGSEIVYTCDPSVDAATCTYLNTTVASYYKSKFTNATANIYIQYGITGLGESTTGYFNTVSYSEYVAALTRNTNQSAVQSSALSALSTDDETPYRSNDEVITSALGMALGFTGMAGTTSSGALCILPSIGCYIGIITVISDPQDFGFSLYYDNRGGTEPSDAYDFYAVVQHETNEVLGTSSCIDTENSGELVNDSRIVAASAQAPLPR